MFRLLLLKTDGKDYVVSTVVTPPAFSLALSGGLTNALKCMAGNILRGKSPWQ